MMMNILTVIAIALTIILVVATVALVVVVLTEIIDNVLLAVSNWAWDNDRRSADFWITVSVFWTTVVNQ